MSPYIEIQFCHFLKEIRSSLLALGQVTFVSGNVINTGWPKSNVPKVRAYCSASDHLLGCVGIFTDSRNI